MQALESTKNQIVDTQPILSDELVAVKNLIEYLEQNHQALAIRGSSTRFLESISSNGENPQGHGTSGYSYWTVVSPRFNPSLLEAQTEEQLRKVRNDLGEIIGSASSYHDSQSGPVVLITVVSESDLTQNDMQRNNIPSDPRVDMRYSGWWPGVSSLNYGKGQQGYPGWRTNQTIPYEQLSVYTLGENEQVYQMEERIILELLKQPHPV